MNPGEITENTTVAEQALALCYEIEELPASQQQTSVSLMASALQSRLHRIFSRPILPSIDSGPLTRTEVIESLRELRDMAYKWEKQEDQNFVRCPDLETVLDFIEENGLEPKCYPRTV